MKRLSNAISLATAALLLSGCATAEQVALKDDTFCKSIGTEPGTDLYALCRIERTTANDEASARRKAALVAFTGALAASSSSDSSSSSAVAARSGGDSGICFKQGERVAGLNKLCSYRCGLSTRVETVRAAQMCPFSP